MAGFFSRNRPGFGTLPRMALGETSKMVIVQLVHDNRQVHRDYTSERPSFGPAPEALLRGLAARQDVTVHVISCLQEPVRSPKKLTENTWYHALHVPQWGWLRTGYQGCIRAVRQRVAEIRPDVVHAQGTERDCGLCAVFSGRPNVLTIHGNMRAVAKGNRARPFSFEWLTARFESFVLPRTWGVLCNSQHTEALVRPLARRVWRVPNALNPLYFTAPTRERHPVPRLVCAGTILPNKRQVDILEMARGLHAKGLRFELQFIGPIDPNAAYTVEFRRRIQEAESQGFGTYLGPMQPETMLGALDAASAMVHAAKEESFGLVIAEGLARNLKLFAFDNGGIKETAAGAEGAEFFKEGDWGGMAGAIQGWLESGARGPTTAAALMRNRYHHDVIAARTIEVYREVIRHARGS